MGLRDRPGVTKLGSGPYSSDDPATEGLRQLPLLDDNSAAEDGEPSSGSESLNAGDFKDRVSAATSTDELDAVEKAYEDQGDEFVTVETAIEKKRAELSGGGE